MAKRRFIQRWQIYKKNAGIWKTNVLVVYLQWEKKPEMVVRFEHQYLKELFVSGKCSDKKHRFRSDIVERYQHRIGFLIEAPNVERLYRYGALNFEALKGGKTGTYSIRVNHKYRIEFSISEEGTEPVATVCNILELSNHYK